MAKTKAGSVGIRRNFLFIDIILRKKYCIETMSTTDLQQIANLLDQKLEEKLKPIEKDIKTIKKDSAETRTDVKVLISYFDREYVNLRKRIEAIEEHLGISPIQ